MDSKTRLFASAPGWPSIVDMKCGGAITLERKGRAWALRLISVRVEKSHDLRPGALHGNKMFKEAKVLLEVDGSQCLLRLAPSMPPVSFHGLRLHVETVKALNAIDASAKESFHYDARISAVSESEPWAPQFFRFPLPGHVWRANPCYGVWGALHCGDSSRYSDGCNLGVSEESSSVVAALSGFVKSVSVKPGAKGLATIVLEHIHGVRSVYGCILPSSIPYGLDEGKTVEIGDLLGKACMDNVPPHLHFGLEIDGARVNPYPALLESYLRMSSDGAAPFAGGQLFCAAGEKLHFDALQATVLRPGRSVSSISWLLSDGSAKKGPQAEMVYKAPGFYSEELRLALDGGEELRDAVQVRVFSPGEKGQPGFPGWISHSPACASAKAPLSFRIQMPEGFKAESMDFGDGSVSEAPAAELFHSYGSPGVYTVLAKGVGSDGSPFNVKRFVRVQG